MATVILKDWDNINKHYAYDLDTGKAIIVKNYSDNPVGYLKKFLFNKLAVYNKNNKVVVETRQISFEISETNKLFSVSRFMFLYSLNIADCDGQILRLYDTCFGLKISQFDPTFDLLDFEMTFFPRWLKSLRDGSVNLDNLSKN